MSDKIEHITEASFEAEVTNRRGLVLVDFWAAWCGPCMAMMPLLEQVATEYEGQLVIKKINVEEHTTMRETHNVSGIPTLVLFKDGVECDRQRGLVNKKRIVDFLIPHIEQASAANGS